ncbi:MAG: hypothetical protein KBT12_07180 [Bacteroidales bacterium]|nr:hypothetical protein [Candidatus Physcousia equi]
MFCSIAFIAYATRSPRSPYRDAFGWVNFICALQIIFGISKHIFPDCGLLRNDVLIATVDATVIPFMLLEAEAIYRQSLKELTWRQRWTKLLLQEVPFLALIVTTICYDGQHSLILLCAYALPFTLYSFVRVHFRLKEYERIISYTSNQRNRSVKWVKWVITSNLLIIFTYSILFPFFREFHYLPLVIYFLLNIALTCTHAYFIYQQRPEKTREIRMIQSVITKEKKDIEEKLRQVSQLSEELEENAKKIKRKADIKEYTDAFMLQHPHFCKRLDRVATHKLTKHDHLLCMLIYDNHKIPDIAHMVGVNSKSVEMARSRLRKKLELDSSTNLQRHITSITDAD